MSPAHRGRPAGGAGNPSPAGAAGTPSRAAGPVLVKCVAWDLDNTLLSGVYLESGESPPEPDPVMASLLAELGRRGILHAVASRNPPAAAAYAEQALGCQFAAVECGWGRKPDALARIAAGLGIGIDALAFVDDDPYQRAEVSAALPAVMVLSPEEAAEAAGWPEFSPPAVTDEARRRGLLYAARRRRQEAARAFGGSREDFLRSARTRVTIARAVPADAPRLHELSVRTHQFNSATRVVARADFTSMITSGDRDVITVRLRDAFSDDGIVGGCVVERCADGAWSVGLLMMSCRAMGRGVIGALLSWLARTAAGEGARALEIPCVLNERNVPLRLALVGAGFRAVLPPRDGDAEAGAGRAIDARAGCGAGTGAGAVARAGDGAGAGTGSGGSAQAEPTLFRRDLDGPLPDLPGWVAAPGEPDPDAG